MELGESDTLLRQLVDMRCADLTAITAQIRPAQIIGADQYNVGKF